MVPITAPVSAAAVVTYKSVRCPITTICAGWAAAQVNNGTQPGACSDETKRCLAGSSSYSYEYYRAAAVLCPEIQGFFRIHINVYTLPILPVLNAAE